MREPSIPETPNVTLVSFYGSKPPELEALVLELQQQISETEALGRAFEVYASEQVHATLLGCEGLRTRGGVLSKWFYERRGEERYVDLHGFIHYVRASGRLPLTVRLGGFRPDVEYGFDSRNQHPFERSFQFQKEKDPGGRGQDLYIPVLMGWPCRGRLFPPDLDRLRLGAQSFNLLHKFHARPEAVDNDLYLRLGVLRNLTPEGAGALRELEGRIRNSLRERTPVHVSVETGNVAFARYEETTLAPGSTRRVALREATAADLEALYPGS